MFESQREVVESLLTNDNAFKRLYEKYEEEGVVPLEQGGAILKVKPLNEMGSAVELVNAFGSKKEFYQAIKELGREIYKTA